MEKKKKKKELNFGISMGVAVQVRKNNPKFANNSKLAWHSL